MARKSKIEGDFYPTPEWVTRCLLKSHEFSGSIWECACGDGKISEVLKPHYQVLSTDLYDRGYSDYIVDFLSCDKSLKYPDNIVTNPPFSLATPFIKKALELAVKEVAFLLPTTFLNTQERGAFLEANKPSRIIYLKDRVDFQNKGAPDVTCTFVWVIWSKLINQGLDALNWIGKKDLL